MSTAFIITTGNNDENLMYLVYLKQLLHLIDSLDVYQYNAAVKTLMGSKDIYVLPLSFLIFFLCTYYFSKLEKRCYVLWYYE